MNPMNPTAIRLISPSKRRLWSPKPDDDRPALTEGNLRHAGWIDYRGPGHADQHGWVVTESDPEFADVRFGGFTDY
jgi:hypothetical protein